MVNGTGLIHDIILPSLPAVVVVQRANAVVQQLPDRHNTAVGLRTAVVKHLQLPINLLPSYAISIAAGTNQTIPNIFSQSCLSLNHDLFIVCIHSLF